MQLSLPIPPPHYRSKSQQIRVSSEQWAGSNLYCPGCPSPALVAFNPNNPAVDFECPKCRELFQLKSSKASIATRIPDAAYGAMVNAIRNDSTPNIIALHYDSFKWKVQDLVLIPRFLLSISAIQKRKPLSESARRRGWVGCTILLDAIPASGRIAVVENGIVNDPFEVRRQFRRLNPLRKLPAEIRGWALDVLRVVESFRRTEFSLRDVYLREDDLQKLHPKNKHIQPKIRQQLQRLRDLGLLEFLGDGRYRLC